MWNCWHQVGGSYVELSAGRLCGHQVGGSYVELGAGRLRDYKTKWVWVDNNNSRQVGGGDLDKERGGQERYKVNFRCVVASHLPQWMQYLECFLCIINNIRYAEK